MSFPGARLVACSVVFAAGFSSFAQFTPPDDNHVRSVSGQFLIHGLQNPSPTFVSLTLATNRDYLRLDPTLLAVSCERIKQSLLRDLVLPAASRAKIYVEIYPGQGENVAVNTGQFYDGWQYQVELPEVVLRRAYVRGVVEALLLEVANRGAETRSAEIPPWLSEGFAERLLASSEVTLIPPSPRPAANGPSFQATIFNSRRQDPLAAARDQLRRHPLTFEELSWPTEDSLAGDAGESYRRAAQLLVHELLAFSDGPACFRRLLAALPNRQNWQFAFLDGFRSHFQTPLDIEKWWALHLTHFTGREIAQTWPPLESWHKLDEALHTTVQVRSQTNELPLHSDVPLQNLVREWQEPARRQALLAKSHELQLLRVRVAPVLVPLVSDYIATVDTYLENSRKIKSSLIPVLRQSRLQSAIEATVNRLDELDTERRLQCPVTTRAAGPGRPESSLAPGENAAQRE